MDNKKIPTSLGTIIILIITLTVGWLVWKCEEKNDFGEIKIQNANTSQPTRNNNKKKEDMVSAIDTSNWKICRNEKANYEFKYPDDWLIVDKYLTVYVDCDNTANARGTGFSIGPDRYNASNKSFGINTTTQKDLETTIYKGSSSLDEYYSQNNKLLNSRIKLKETALQNDRVDWFKEQNDNKISIWFFHNKTFYEIRTNIQDMNILEAIVNTFKFPNS